MRKPLKALLIVAVAAATILPVALAQGATSTPTVTTSPATSVSNTGATLNGTVNPNGQQTNYAFQWGPTNGYGHETALTSAGAGTSASSVSAALTGLASGSTYHFRIIAMNASGTSVGSDQSFTTTGSAPPPSPAPTATTGSTSAISGTGAKVAGTVNAMGQATTYYFEYGQTADYGFETTATSAGSGTGNQNVTADLSGLSPGTAYHYRLVASSAGGTALGADNTFTTATAPTASTGGASNVSISTATVTGTVNPQGSSTSYYFQYGTTTTYGLQTAPADAGSTNGNVAVNRDLLQLAANTIYHYRLVAQNAGGTATGADMTFKTPASVQTPSHVAFMGRMGFVSPGAIIGVEAGCFGGSARCTGHVTMSHNGTVIGQRNFNIAPNSGGFQNLGLSFRGKRLLRNNRVFRLLAVEVHVTTTSGQDISQVMHLARWVWH